MMAALLMAFFLWMLIRALESRGGGLKNCGQCRLCQSDVLWTGDHFVHDDGLIDHPYWPAIWVDVADPNSPEMTHRALPW
jgi:hypothetical protein